MKQLRVSTRNLQKVGHACTQYLDTLLADALGVEEVAADGGTKGSRELFKSLVALCDSLAPIRLAMTKVPIDTPPVDWVVDDNGDVVAVDRKEKEE